MYCLLAEQTDALGSMKSDDAVKQLEALRDELRDLHADSTSMAYEYRCATVDGEHVDETLNEWASAGWELQTVSTVLFHKDGKDVFYHSLFFRHLKGWTG